MINKNNCIQKCDLVEKDFILHNVSFVVGHRKGVRKLHLHAGGGSFGDRGRLYVARDLQDRDRGCTPAEQRPLVEISGLSLTPYVSISSPTQKVQREGPERL